MTKLLYIPHGEYVRFVGKEHDWEETIIYEESVFYEDHKDITYFIQHSVNNPWVHINTNKENEGFRKYIEEFEIIYD